MQYTILLQTNRDETAESEAMEKRNISREDD